MTPNIIEYNPDDFKYISENKWEFIKEPERSEWICYMFGASAGNGISYRPLKDKQPNWFVRYMMKVCFDCTWIKDKQ
jgi:hypothetical protein